MSISLVRIEASLKRLEDLCQLNILDEHSCLEKLRAAIKEHIAGAEDILQEVATMIHMKVETMEIKFDV
jgi:hypothetical protein